MRDLVDLLERAPPQALAIQYGERAVSFADLASESARIAAGLAALGIARGDRVAIWLPNIPAWLAVFFACARLGAIAVSVNTRFRAHEVADIVARSGARTLILWPDFRGIDFAGILADVPDAALARLEHIVTYTEDPHPLVQELRGLPTGDYGEWLTLEPSCARSGTATDRCVIFTTSGTTRAPKFVCHVQQAVIEHARDVVAAFALEAPDARVLQALPMCGVFGFTQALAALAAAAPMDMLAVFDAPTAATVLREHRVTHTHGVDDMIAALLKAVPDPIPFPHLRHFGFAAFNPALDDIVVRAEARGLKVRGLYGMSECHALYAMQPADLPVVERAKGGGRPVSPRARVRVRDPDTGALLGPGERGELEVSGPSLLHEYFDDPEATAAAFTADGFLRTGDLACLEPDGRFRYVARMGDVLRLGGFLTSPLEIEAVIDEHAAVTASQVVAIELGGRQVAVAFVLASSAETVDEHGVIAHCRARLAGYKVPQRVFTLANFPTTASANGTKIQKAELRRMAIAMTTPDG